MKENLEDLYSYLAKEEFEQARQFIKDCDAQGLDTNKMRNIYFNFIDNLNAVIF